jgi:SOS-response transcriptional repressor LexA
MNALSPIKPARVGLTGRQRDCFKAIERHIALCGHSPTSRELAKVMGLKNHSAAYNLLVALQERGWIRFLPRKTRSITIVRDDPAPAGYVLPAELDAKLRAHCAAVDDDPADVVADAVAMFFDDAEGSVAA